MLHCYVPDMVVLDLYVIHVNVLLPVQNQLIEEVCLVPLFHRVQDQLIADCMVLAEALLPPMHLCLIALVQLGSLAVKYFPLY